MPEPVTVVCRFCGQEKDIWITESMDERDRNQSSCQVPSVRLHKNDADHRGDTFVCQCGQSGVSGCHSQLCPRARTLSVTYKKRLGPEKVLVVRQEVQKPLMTCWNVFMGFLLALLLFWIWMGLRQVTNRISKSEEIMSVTILLLFILLYFRPCGFILFFIFSPCEDSREICH